MICRKCGAQIANDATFCKHCGANQKKTDVKVIVLLVSIVFALLIILGLLCFIFFTKKEEVYSEPIKTFDETDVEEPEESEEQEKPEIIIEPNKPEAIEEGKHEYEHSKEEYLYMFSKAAPEMEKQTGFEEGYQYAAVPVPGYNETYPYGMWFFVKVPAGDTILFCTPEDVEGDGSGKYYYRYIRPRETFYIDMEDQRYISAFTDEDNAYTFLVEYFRTDGFAADHEMIKQHRNEYDEITYELWDGIGNQTVTSDYYEVKDFIHDWIGDYAFTFYDDTKTFDFYDPWQSSNLGWCDSYEEALDNAY